jgi:hypothetical protein
MCFEAFLLVLVDDFHVMSYSKFIFFLSVGGTSLPLSSDNLMSLEMITFLH